MGLTVISALIHDIVNDIFPKSSDDHRKAVLAIQIRATSGISSRSLKSMAALVYISQLLSLREIKLDDLILGVLMPSDNLIIFGHFSLNL